MVGSLGLETAYWCSSQAWSLQVMSEILVAGLGEVEKLPALCRQPPTPPPQQSRCPGGGGSRVGWKEPGD